MSHEPREPYEYTTDWHRNQTNKLNKKTKHIPLVKDAKKKIAKKMVGGKFGKGMDRMLERQVEEAEHK